MISVSIISHGHSLVVQKLLLTLTHQSTDLEVILTINSPTLESASWLNSLHEFDSIRVVFNSKPKGFAENHNSAAEIANAEYFCILNPDISLVAGTNDNNGWDYLLKNLQALASPLYVGLSYPKQIDGTGKMLDFERTLVTPWQLIRRHILTADHSQHQSVDWVSGSCMMFRTEIFRKLGGFDERYHLYCEDVDICLRMQLAGYKLVNSPCTVVHDTRRQTLKNYQHLIWHLQSLIKLWFSSAFWQYMKFRITQ